MSSNLVEELKEIVTNLETKQEIRSQGWEYFLALTSAEDGTEFIIGNKDIIPFFASCLLSSGDKLSLKMAHKCLINISSCSSGASAIVSNTKDLLIHLLKSISDIKSSLIEEKCYILSNISTFSNVVLECGLLSQLKDLLSNLWLGYDNVDPDIRLNYKFLALFLANISKERDGRLLLLNDENFLKRFIRHIDSSEHDVRRLGAALTLRNLCLETDFHKKLLEETHLLPVLLLPLMGPEEYEDDEMEKLPIDCQYLESSKEREKVPQVRKALVQALSLLCYSEQGWNCLKASSVYSVTRELHLWEPDPDAKEAIETLVGFLLVLEYSDAEKLVPVSPLDPSVTDFLKDIPDIVLCHSN